MMTKSTDTFLDRKAPSEGGLASMLMLAGMPVAMAIVAFMVPGPLVLPVFAAVAILIALALEGIVLVRRRAGLSSDSLHVLAAALVFAGLAATILADTDAAVVALGQGHPGLNVASK